MRIQNNGLGVQSTTIFLMSHEGLIEPLDHSIFADTQDEDAEVYEHLAWLRTVPAPVPLLHVGTAGCLGDDLTRGENSTGQRFATIPAYTAPPVEERQHGWKEGMVRRQCTKEYKVEVVAKILRRVILGLKPRQRRPKDVPITQVFGISWDERIRAVAIEKRVTAEGFSVEFPLIDRRMTRDDCKAFLKGRVPHETPRSACVYCPYKRAAEWLRTKSNPKSWARALQIDRALRTPGVVANRNTDQQLFLHRSCLPLDQIDFEAEAKREAERKAIPLFEMDDCGEGMCGV